MSDADRPENSSACPRCGRVFVCGMVAGTETCWCAALPPALAVPAAESAGCYCPDCLRELVAAKPVPR